MKTFYTKNNINYILETTSSYPYLNRYENDKLVFSCFLRHDEDIMIAHIQRRFELLRNGLDYNRELSDIIQTKIYKLDNLNTYLYINNYKMNVDCFVKRCGGFEKTEEIFKKI